MRPTPTKARPTSRSPRRSSPQRQKKASSTPKNNTNPPSARRSIKRGLEDSLGKNPSLAETPLSKTIQRSRRGRSPDVGLARVGASIPAPAVTSSDKNINSSAIMKSSSSSSGGRPKKAYGKRAKMSPRSHGAAIAKSLASPSIDSTFLMSSTAPITPSKRSSAESALHYLARGNTKRGRNTTTTATQVDDEKNNNISSKKKKQQPRRSAAKTTKVSYVDEDSDGDVSSSDLLPPRSEQQQLHVEFIPKGKLEERWLRNFNKWKQSAEEQGLEDDDTAHQLPLPKSWVNAQRKEYKAMNQNEKTSMTQSKVDVLESYGFTWDAPIGRQKRNSSSSNNEEDAAAAHVGVKNDVSKRRRKSSGDGKNNKSIEEVSTSKRASPRKSCPTQFYHNFLGKEKREDKDERSNDGAVEQKKVTTSKTNTSVFNVQAIKEGNKCRKCGEPKKGHTCTMDKADDDEKAIESLVLIASSSDDKDQPTKQKREGKKRRSRGGRQKGSLLSSLETLKASSASSKKKKKDVSSGETGKSAKAEEIDVNKPTASKKTKVTSGDATKQNKKPGSKVIAVEKAAPPTRVIEKEAVTADDQPISPFASSPLRTSNLECPESGSISVGQAQNSPAKKNVPETICIRELMMSCLTEADKEEEKRNTEVGGAELKSTEQEEEDDDDDGGAMEVDAPLPNTPIQSKEASLSTFSPLSMTSPLRANNLLETSYSDEPEVQDKSLPHENRADSPPNHPAEHRSAGSSRRPNQLVQNPPRTEIATQTSERVDGAKQHQLIQAEKQYQKKMAEFGKLELEARIVTERMRQIEERMRQIESSSISNDLREYDEIKRRASYPYPTETLRPSKRKMITSQRHYGSSDDDFSDEFDSHRNWRHSTHGRHEDPERSKRRKIRSDSRRSRSPSRSQSNRGNSQRRRIEDSATKGHRLSVSRKLRKKGSKKKIDEAGRRSTTQMNRTSLKSPYAVLQTDEARLRETRQPDVSSDAKVQIEKDASDAEEDENDTATYTESAKMPDKANEENKKDSDSASTNQSSVEPVEKSNDAVATHHNKTQNKDKSKDPLYWLAGGESDSDEESWDFDGPMILPPPPA